MGGWQQASPGSGRHPPENSRRARFLAVPTNGSLEIPLADFRWPRHSSALWAPSFRRHLVCLLFVVFVVDVVVVDVVVVDDVDDDDDDDDDVAFPFVSYIFCLSDKNKRPQNQNN